MESQGLLGFDTPQPPQPELPKLRTFVVRRHHPAEYAPDGSLIVEQVVVHAHLIQPFSENGSIAFVSYALVGNELTGSYTRIFNAWLDVEEITLPVGTIIH